MIKRLDEALGRLLALKSLGLREDTIVLFTTDHGCHFKTRNGGTSAPAMIARSVAHRADRPRI